MRPARTITTPSSPRVPSSIAGIGTQLLGCASVAALLHQVAMAQGACARASRKNGGAAVESTLVTRLQPRPARGIE